MKEEGGKGESHAAFARFMRSVRKDASGCWIWIGSLLHDGYGAFAWPRGRQVKAHRMSWIIFKGDIPPGKCVLHDCPAGDTRACVNWEHLWLGTRGDNNRDREAKGRGRPSRGSRNGMAKLTERDVLEIRTELALGVPGTVLARRWDVDHTLIYMIKNRKAWNHVR